MLAGHRGRTDSASEVEETQEVLVSDHEVGQGFQMTRADRIPG